MSFALYTPSLILPNNKTHLLQRTFQSKGINRKHEVHCSHRAARRHRRRRAHRPGAQTIWRHDFERLEDRQLQKDHTRLRSRLHRNGQHGKHQPYSNNVSNMRLFHELTDFCLPGLFPWSSYLQWPQKEIPRPSSLPGCWKTLHSRSWYQRPSRRRHQRRCLRRGNENVQPRRL